MRGGARVLPGARCFRGAARRFLVWAARRFLACAARRLFAQSFGGALAPLGSPPCFAAVIPRAGLCAGLLCRARARIINFSLI